MTAIAFVAVFFAGLGAGSILTILVALKLEEIQSERQHARALKNLRDADVDYTILNYDKAKKV